MRARVSELTFNFYVAYSYSIRNPQTDSYPISKCLGILRQEMILCYDSG